eukprot:gnl/MRDRNA2_/MRDRNA2_102798_c0_seq1.p1 gnl/MRDRNA2_/MRDRNA2_102798_c0~~gnl/MRDRNA2_/MRDRNA2_102798_c0_seq1.p1  ORF type:complete len:133 (-),score=27.38 gnl/MRDRNA2_/MRDRNA2_102798_c0_seq1:89-487(-)
MSVKVRDLDYVNPRHKLPSCALPPEVRAQLGLAPAKKDETKQVCRSSSQKSYSSMHQQLAKGGQSNDVYRGSSNVAVASCNGTSGAGTCWENEAGHAFVRRGTSQDRTAWLQERAKEKRLQLSQSMSRRRGL